MYYCSTCIWCFFFQAEDGIRYLVRSRGLGDVYKRQALFFKQDDEWECATHLQADQLASRHDLGPILKRYTKTQRIIDTDPEPLQGFDLVIPVYHKKNPIAFALVGGAVSYTHLRAHETVLDLVCRLLLEKKK